MAASHQTPSPPPAPPLPHRGEGGSKTTCPALAPPAPGFFSPSSPCGQGGGGARRLVADRARRRHPAGQRHGTEEEGKGAGGDSQGRPPCLGARARQCILLSRSATGEVRRGCVLECGEDRRSGFLSGSSTPR